MSFNLQTPRPANAKEIADWGRIFPKLGSNFKILAPEQEEGSDGCYNCLGWASGEVKNFLSFDAFKDAQLEARFAKLGLVKCGEAEATIDAWYLPGEAAAEHVSKKDPVTGKWTSKLGPDGPLIEHERYAFADSDYGSVKLHFGPPSGGAASTQSVSAQSIEPGFAMESVPDVTDDDIAAVESHAALFTSLAVAPKPAPKPKAPVKPAPAKPTAPVKPAPAKPTIPVKPTPAKPTPAPTKPTAPVKPAPTKPTTPAKPAPAKPAPNPVAAQFEKAYTAWQATWKTPKVRIASRDDGYKKSAEYKALVKLGPAILPLLAAKLAQRNQIYAAIPWLELDKGAHKIPSTDILTQKKAILKTSAATVKALSSDIEEFGLNRDKILGGAINGLKAAAELINDPLFQQIVSRGAPAVAQILDDYAKNGAHGKAIWIEALKQIHQIEQEHKGESFPQQLKDFETWLASYTGQTVPTEAPVESDPATEPAAEPEVDPTTASEATPEGGETQPQ
ncbi:hypothetical protein BR93DRAFT_922939 [Coniochaeta sp. PMI_546]|nr:hypothetical protein BR93DRAFT_922939 [Coniochaeta sp. PMI_546]